MSESKEMYDKKKAYLDLMDEEILIKSIEEHLKENFKGQDRYKAIDSLSNKDVYYCFTIKAREIQEREQKTKEGSTHVD